MELLHNNDQPKRTQLLLIKLICMETPVMNRLLIKPFITSRGGVQNMYYQGDYFAQLQQYLLVVVDLGSYSCRVVFVPNTAHFINAY